ncbi:toprim domain-containing protein [Streptococcus pasteurianus]|nr:toprim domain-containing protein [Streptococcus pasteurianus]
MAEEHTQQQSPRGKSRRERVEHARSRDILDVANELSMELVQSGRDYRWKEHDSMVISPEKNMWNWFSRHQGGDVIALVQTMKEVNFNQAIDFLNDGTFKEFTHVERVQEPFTYYLQPYEQPFEAARDYLKEQRGLSDETIDFFLEKGVLAQANAKVNGSIEPVVVFKSFDFSGEIVGATLQGIEENWEKWPERGYAKNIVRNSDGITGMHVDIGQPNRLIFAESAIDLMSYYELNKEKLQDVRLVSMDGLKESVVGRHLAQLQADISGRPLRWTHDQLAEGLQTAIDNNFFTDGKHANWITLVVDNDEGGRTFIDSLQKKGAAIISDLPELQAGQEKTDWNDYLQIAYDADLLVSGKEQESVVVPEEKEKSLEMTQEMISESRQQKNAEGTIGDFPDNNQEAAPLPEANQSQPLNDLSPSQTQPQPLLHFSINEDGQSINKRHYHAISSKDLVKLNRYAPTLQQAANWYLNELADSKIYYFYQQNDSIQTLQVLFDKDKFQHLTGVFPYKEGQSAEQTLEDFANGNGAFDTILLANKGAAFDKLKVLPELPAIVESDSFYFGDLSEVPKLHSLDLDKAIKSGDEDIILALRTVDNTTFPASLMKVRTGLKNQLAQSADENIILGVYRERNGQIDQLSINEEFVKDGGQEMLSILENKQYEEALEPSQEIVQSDTISAELFKQVLDAAYNAGDPRQLGTELPEESKAAWEHYYELSDGHDGNFTAVIAAADQQELVDKSSHFYQEWHQDRIYNETYHVRLQWSEIWPDGPQIPFKETELVEYQTFAEELYKQNRALYDSHQESLATGNQADYVPFTKVKFDVYAPGGILIKDNIRYDIGDETEPISRLLGLGYRRLEGQPELAAIDEKILSQLEKQEVNQEIATEANEQNLKMPDILLDETNNPREHFQSPNQEMKVSLAQRLEEIMAEESVKNPVRENEQEHPVTSDEPFDYKTASAYDVSERAFQKIREYTQSPEDLMEYVEFMSKFPQLSPRNVALIQDQWRGANAVATYDQWKSMGEALGIKPEDVIQTKATYVNKRTGETKEVIHQGLSVKTGEKSQITLFRPLMVRMVPVIDENGNHIKNNKGNPKYKKFSDATPQEKELVKDGKLPVRQFQERDPKTGQPRFTTYKVFELSQTTLKPESYPKAMPNRHYNFNTDKVKTKEVLEGLCDYAESIGVSIMKDEAHVLGNAKGAFFPGEQLILINPDNTPGEKIATTIHELAHATLHNPSLADQYKELPKVQKELEAEMTSHLLSKYFGLDTTEKAIDYMAKWTDNLKGLDDKQLADSLKRIHKTVSKMHKQIEHHTQPYQPGKNRGQAPNFPKAPTKGPSR